ncbi:MAG: putative manganese-dependent inorganic diphosphatase [Clostridia bacterium]|nr:putative manganese-dependent inorganic diphosphatase [Clostridia bacterium]
MSDIYVTGHRNPDTDSIVAAISYTGLMHSLGDRSYRAMRLGSINDETRRMLAKFGFDAPEYTPNLKTQVKDIQFDRPPILNETVSTEFAWNTMEESDVSTMPVTDDEGRLSGIITKGDIATFDMQTIEHNHIEDVPVFNMISALEGTMVNELNYFRGTLSGTVVIGIQSDDGMIADFNENSIVICGGHTPTIEQAVKAGVACIIISHSDIRPEWADIGEQTLVISTPLSGRAVARKIYQATPCGRICKKDDIVSFKLNDYVDDVREAMLKTRYHCYPVLDNDGKVVGVLSRIHLLRPERKQVVLVDHNEIAQSVPALDQIDILGIIDHHRLADIQTTQPIAVRNEPVGSTNTIIAEMYQERGVMPSPAMAGLMASAILSDTVMFKSPTCTRKDIAMTERLCRIAKVTVEELGKELFSSSNDEKKSADQLFFSDYKQFNISDRKIGISQITSDNNDWFVTRREEFFTLMENFKARENFDMVILMITDILHEGTDLYFVGKDEIIERAFGITPVDSHIFLAGVMSRKKQIIPKFTDLLG